MNTQRNAPNRQDHSNHGILAEPLANLKEVPGIKGSQPLLMILLSTHHSPITVNKKARVFTIGTVKLNSSLSSRLATLSRPHLIGGVEHNLPAFPINKKNHTLPVKFSTNGTAYRGLRKRSATAKTVPYSRLRTKLFLTSSLSSSGCGGGRWSLAARRMKGVVNPQARPTMRKPST